jgi:hypothetical protein
VSDPQFTWRDYAAFGATLVVLAVAFRIVRWLVR